MIKIFESASKIVFLMLAVTVCVSFFMGRLESTDFMVLTAMAFTFYFANKGDSKEKYAGK